LTARIIMKMAVSDVRIVTDNVRLFTFRHPRRTHLPAPTPGAHVDVRLPTGQTRQYSLCSDPGDDTLYQIAVKREDEGRGGSRWIHENLHVGSIIPVSAPRNNFPLADATNGAASHVLIAGGIGVTPILSMARHLTGRKVPFDIHYCARSSAAAPFLPLLREMCGDRLSTYFSGEDPVSRLDVEGLLKSLAPETHVYCCGPNNLTRAFVAANAGRPDRFVHYEIFKPEVDENFVPEPFEVKLSSTGDVLKVPADKSALDVLRERGFTLPSSCELGVCGSCTCRYTEGTVIHRDSCLDAVARRDKMTPCVSRAQGSVTLAL
jgi:ferredoxin-NADP reductase